MLETQIESTPAPMSRQQCYVLWLTLANKLHAMGLLDEPLGPELDARSLRGALDAAQRHGLLRAHRPLLEHVLALRDSDVVPSAAVRALGEAVEVLENSPVPETEWPAMSAILGEATLAALTGVSASSVKRYGKAERVASDEIADRLHFVAMVVADLAGSYNELGIRRWFERPRAQLRGKSPREALGEDWQSTSAAAQSVRRLAASLLGAGAT